MTTPLAVSVVGAGAIGRRHIAEIAASSRTIVHSIVDPDMAAAELAATLGVPHFPAMERLLAGPKPDGVVIASPNALHVPHALAAIAERIPALVEKPIADDVSEGRRLVAAAAAAGVPLLVGHHRRHNPLIAVAKAALQANRIGRIVAAHGFFWILKPDSYFDTPWRRSPGAGPLLLNLIHDIDLLRHLIGEIAAVQAFQSNAVRGHPVDETTVVSLRFSCGALGTFTVSDTIVAPWSWEQTSGENPMYPRTDQFCCVIGGTHGSLTIPDLRLWRNPGARGWTEPFDEQRLPVEHANPMARQLAHFCDVIGGALPLVPGLEGLRTLAAVMAVRQAADENSTVEVAPC